MLVALNDTNDIDLDIEKAVGCAVSTRGVKYSHTQLRKFVDRGFQLRDELPNPRFHGFSIDEARNRIIVKSEEDPFPAEGRAQILSAIPSDAVGFEGGVPRLRG